mmetsp:Transcript_20753/g.36939  ORF Transcript_20753/g.36939 Transcript_20753/m.36939 type:complete len:176 (+) Transcript_20753:135-662(+)
MQVKKSQDRRGTERRKNVGKASGVLCKAKEVGQYITSKYKTSTWAKTPHFSSMMRQTKKRLDCKAGKVSGDWKREWKCEECEASRGSRKNRNTVFTKEHIAKHCTSSSCWLTAHGKVYDVSSFLDLHPAGRRSIMSRGGQDVTRDYDFHSKTSYKIWEKLRIGYVQNDNDACVVC